MEPEKQGFFKETQELVEDYIRERLLLLKLQTAEKAAVLASVVFAGVIIGSLVFIILLFISLLACYFLEELTGSWYYGIGIVILFYVVITGILIYKRKSLLYKFVSDSVLKFFFEKTDESDEIR
ncbi:MAG TPA: hypothetical protein VEZ17_01780 [Chitinophagaceae bacterium]|jgi:energy-coupling factor transporter transmembrane protein EcfT|nr:hypothetical protein [Chitinophagaceae bacterium]